MLKELFESVRQSAEASCKPQPVKLDLPNGVVRVYDPDGTWEDITGIPARNHVLGSVDVVGPFVEYHKSQRSADPVVWFNDRGVTVVLDDNQKSRRNDQATLLFEPTEEFTFVTEMSNENPPEKLSAKEMIKLLRRDLWDAFDSEAKRDSLIKLLRSVRFDDDEQQKFGTVKRTINSTADGEGEFPSFVVLSLRPFDDPALKTRCGVKCHFEVDPDSKSFSLVPIKSELKKATDEALQALQELLVANVSCPIHRGSPA